MANGRTTGAGIVPNGDDWQEYRRLVLSELERINSHLGTLTDKTDHAELKQDMGDLRDKMEGVERFLKREHNALERRVLVIETEAKAEAKAAGKTSGLIWGCVGSVVVGLILFGAKALFTGTP